MLDHLWPWLNRSLHPPADVGGAEVADGGAAEEGKGALELGAKDLEGAVFVAPIDDDLVLMQVRGSLPS